MLEHLLAVDGVDAVGCGRVGGGCVEVHGAERLLGVVREDRRLHRLVDVLVCQAAAVEFVQRVVVGPVDFPEVGAVAVGAHQHDALDFVFGEEREYFVPLFFETAPRVPAVALGLEHPRHRRDQHLECAA